MEKIRAISIFGTRPEAIKMAPLVKTLENDDRFRSYVCVTAQHRQMLDQVLSSFNVRPDFDLNIMKDRQTIHNITTKALVGLADIISEVNPHIVLVHGDTTTTFASALAAFYNKNKTGHVEAGLRSFDKYQPYPEEINRKLTGVLADLHFAPTSGAKENLLNENIPEKDIFVTGNTVIDAMSHTVKNGYIFKESVLNQIDFGKRVITVTAHRRENLGEPLVSICNAILRIKKAYQDSIIVYPVHKNPAVLEPVTKMLGNLKDVYLTEPLEIEDMHNLISRSYIIMTDSGGIQEEAPSLNKPVLVLRNVTERPEGINTGALMLAGTEEDKIFDMASLLFENKDKYNKMALAKNPYGDGLASSRIKEGILYCFGHTDERPLDFV